MALTYAQLVVAVSDYCENTFDTTDMNTMIKQAEQRIYNTVQIANLRKNVTGTITSGNKYLSCPDDFLSVYSIAVYPNGGGNYIYLLNKDVNFMRDAYPNPATTGTPKHYAIFGPQSSNVNELSFILGPTPNATYGTELHYYYYPESIIQSPVVTLGAVTGGSSYTNGTYLNVSLTGGSGSSAVADIVVSGNAVTSVTLTQGGSGYVVGNTLSAAASTVGGTGTGFSVPVATIGNTLGTTWLGDNFDSALLYGTLCEALTYMKGEADMVALINQRYVQAIALLKNLGDGKQRQDAYRDGQVRVQVS
jgi:hypothetical protein